MPKVSFECKYLCDNVKQTYADMKYEYFVDKSIGSILESISDSKTQFHFITVMFE